MEEGWDGCGDRVWGGVSSHAWVSDTHQACNVSLRHYSYAIMDDHHLLQLFLPVCASVCAGQIGYQMTCLSKSPFNCSETECVLYNIILASNHFNQILYLGVKTASVIRIKSTQNSAVCECVCVCAYLLSLRTVAFDKVLTHFSFVGHVHMTVGTVAVGADSL